MPTTATTTVPYPTFTAVTITTAEGVPVEVTGVSVSPYLAVTPAIGNHNARPGFTGRWAVTHIPTGRKIPAGMCGVTEACLHHATEFANRLAETDIDWSAPRHVLVASDHVKRACWELGQGFASCGHAAHCADPDHNGC